MKNSELVDIQRQRLVNIDADFERFFDARRGSVTACVQIGRARAMMRNATQLLDKALAAGVDSGQPRNAAS